MASREYCHYYSTLSGYCDHKVTSCQRNVRQLTQKLTKVVSYFSRHLSLVSIWRPSSKTGKFSPSTEKRREGLLYRTWRQNRGTFLFGGKGGESWCFGTTYGVKICYSDPGTYQGKRRDIRGHWFLGLVPGGTSFHVKHPYSSKILSRGLKFGPCDFSHEILPPPPSSLCLSLKCTIRATSSANKLKINLSTTTTCRS